MFLLQRQRLSRSNKLTGHNLERPRSSSRGLLNNDKQRRCVVLNPSLYYKERRCMTSDKPGLIYHEQHIAPSQSHISISAPHILYYDKRPVWYLNLSIGWMYFHVVRIRKMPMTTPMKICLLPEIYIYTRYRMQDINTLKKSIKHYSFSGSIDGKGGMKPRLMGPNFCYTIENISFWGCRKQEMVHNDRIMTSFFTKF